MIKYAVIQRKAILFQQPGILIGSPPHLRSLNRNDPGLYITTIVTTYRSFKRGRSPPGQSEVDPITFAGQPIRAYGPYRWSSCLRVCYVDEMPRLLPHERRSVSYNLEIDGLVGGRVGLGGGIVGDQCSSIRTNRAKKNVATKRWGWDTDSAASDFVLIV